MTTRTKRTKAAKVDPARIERALHAVVEGLGVLSAAGGDGAATRHAEELALTASFALAERAGLGPLGDMPTASRVAAAHSVLFGGRPADGDGVAIRDVAALLTLAVAGRVAGTVEIEISAEAARLAAAHGGVDRLLAAGATRITAAGARDGAKMTVAMLRRRLALIDRPLARADLAAALARLRRGEALSGVIADLLLTTGALGTNRKSARQSVQDRVSKRLRSR